MLGFVKLLSEVFGIYTLRAIAKGSCFPPSSLTPIVSNTIIIIKFSLDMKRYLIVIFLCISLAVSKVQHHIFLSNVLSGSI